MAGVTGAGITGMTGVTGAGVACMACAGVAGMMTGEDAALHGQLPCIRQ